MASVAEWVEGARLRTWPNAIAPVVAGTGAALGTSGFDLPLAVLSLLVALLLITGVNFANDYSDGIRGTDEERTGPQRLVGSGAARPRSVLAAALGCFALAAVAGLAVLYLSGHWWLLLLGAASIAGAWFYTGGKHPYGYAGFGELAVFCFFGPAAVLGTMYVQADTVNGSGVGAAVAMGSFSSAVLVANNLRDIPTDTASGKRTLAVLLGDRDTRTLYVLLVLVPLLISTLTALRITPALLGFLALPLLIAPLRTVLGGGTGLRLLPVLRDTGLAMLVWAVATAVGFTLA
ncbi:1,4-dihydroxy-2-naphthoate polyprenyltransferase [Actinopolyspora mortivallis]|uniref:1,4-dihydroxy-2-naphthoate polyprenyltransferase n=1 Tax=Actinopolyspora mortivallis TaxID=33906 RepID=UPI00039A6504|nr:1,4-dihydroxy-2-naphthoate polyprenyltransferase [Actinopolyspora mortivallis]